MTGGSCKKREKAISESSGSFDSLIQSLPSDSNAVIGINGAALENSPLVKRAVTTLFAKDPELKKEFDAIREQCKIDLGSDVDQVAIALRGKDTMLALKASQPLSSGAISSCIRTRTKNQGGQLRSKAFGKNWGFEIIPKKNAEPLFLLVFEQKTKKPETLFIATEESFLENTAGNGPSLPVLRLAKTDASVWAAGMVPEDVGAGLVRASADKIVTPPVSMHGYVSFAGGLEAALVVNMASSEDAAALQGLASNQLLAIAAVAKKLQLGPALDKLEIQRKGQDVHFSTTLSKKEVSEMMGR